MLRGSDALVVSEDGQRVRRMQPLTSVEDMAKAVDARSLYAGERAGATCHALTLALFRTFRVCLLCCCS